MDTSPTIRSRLHLRLKVDDTPEIIIPVSLEDLDETGLMQNACV